MILLDGQVSTSALLEDRGLAYGDGLFETIPLWNGRFLCWAAHMARLERGCAVLGLPAPASALLRSEAQQVAAGRNHGIVKIIVTRGSGGRGYRPPASAQLRRIVSLHEWPTPADADTSGAVATWVCRQRLGHNPQLAGIKHLNRLEQVLASAEWPSADYFEGLMLDLDGRLVEGIRSNVFVVRGRELHTPDLSRVGVAGIVRQAVIDIAPDHGLTVHVSEIEMASLTNADELFLCNSVMGLRTVGRIDNGQVALSFPAPTLAATLATHLRAERLIP